MAAHYCDCTEEYKQYLDDRPALKAENYRACLDWRHVRQMGSGGGGWYSNMASDYDSGRPVIRSGWDEYGGDHSWTRGDHSSTWQTEPIYEFIKINDKSATNWHSVYEEPEEEKEPWVVLQGADESGWLYDPDDDFGSPQGEEFDEGSHEWGEDCGDGWEELYEPADQWQDDDFRMANRWQEGEFECEEDEELFRWIENRFDNYYK